MLRKEAEAKREELEDEQKILRGEQNDYKGQLENLLEHFNKQVVDVKLLQREFAPSVHSDIQTLNQSQGTLVGGTMRTRIKLINPLNLPLFSGADATPKDEANYEQWLFQARGVLNSHMEEAVQSRIIRLVRHEVRELMGFIWFQADLTDILDQVEGRFGKAPSADKLQQEFYLL